jgi:membrane AbrB-like protein
MSGMGTRVAMGQVLRMGLAYGVAVAFGYGAALVKMPLAWVLGPLIATALITLAGFKLPAPPVLRRGAQLVIGCTIGLSITSAVVLGLIEWFPLMIATALASVFVSASLSPVLAQLGRIDLKTAFFATMPGGLSEMGNIGASMGAQMPPIAVLHALRVAVVVLLIPPLMVAQGLYQSPVPMPDLPVLWVGIVVAAGLAGAMVARLVRMNNPWMIGGLAGAGMLTAFDLVQGRMPSLIFIAAQILIGHNIGTRFDRATLSKLPRVAVVGFVIILAMISIMALYALLLHDLSGLDLAVAILSSSPGGTAEMATTAAILHLPVALVTAFQMTRAVMVNGFATYYWRILTAIGYLPALERLIARLSSRS